MNRQEECQELLMQDVVRIDIMPQTALRISVPFNVPDVSAAQVTMSDGTALSDGSLFTGSLLSMDFTGDVLTDAEMQEGLSHKVSEKQSAAGMIRTHTLQVPIEAGYQAIAIKERALHDTDFHIVLTTVDGVRYLAYGLPGTSQFSIEEQKGQTAKMTVKATLQSASGFIRIEE